MANEETEVVEQPEIDIDSMSDEELDSFLEEATGVDMNEPTDVVDETINNEEGEPNGLQEEEGQKSEEEVTDEEEADDEAEAEEPADETEEAMDDEADAEESEEAEETPVVNLDGYAPEELQTMETVYNELFKSGIKASGIERTVRDPEHLKTLVRIGFSANENNRKIKPYLKQLRSLEQAGVSLEDDNINFLVDVMNGDKDAIKELIKNRVKLDEETVQSWYDEEDGSSRGYIPKDHVMSDSRFQMQEILEEIKTTPTYDRTVDFLSNIDDDGKVFVSENPEIVKLLNVDMQSGAFDKAMDEVYYRQDRGLLPKQSILQSYVQVMQDESFYSTLLEEAGYSSQQNNTDRATQAKDTKKIVQRKKKASTVGTSNVSTKGSSNKQSSSKDINKMSEEEFEDFYASLGIDD